MNLFELERYTARKLEQFPIVHAPDTLLPRVMAAVRAWAQRPWYQRAWFTWPVAGQVASVVTLCVMTLGVALLFITAQTAAGDAGYTFSAAANVKQEIAHLIGRVLFTGSIAQLVSRALVLAFAPYLIVIIGLTCGAGTALAMVLSHAGLRRTFQS